ncbi:chymotrypsin-like elastase family member 2B [Chironomus tepperi]|uniref:chymotrypsin-like elastase family member 2B n=1 Tax=Chironomus tepperi TaxID=113505 RepID=UPI00391F2FBB
MLKILQIFLILLPIIYVKSDENCGHLKKSNDTNLNDANWPWLASLFYYFNGQYFCSGTLISDRHILTAAHCFSGSNFSTPHQQVFVILGHNNFTKISPFEQIRNASDIKLHPNWKKIDGNYDSDMAVLTLSDPVTFTDYVQPICLPKSTKKSESDELHDLAVTGHIAGYKKSHNNHQISYFQSKIENITSCLFGDETSCSIHSDEFNCNSVSGSGFYAQKDSTSSYKIYGIFSKGINEDDSEFCGLNNFVIFMFVAQYVDWIKSVINEPFLGQKRTGKELTGKELIGSNEIFCDYRWNYEQSEPVYTCIVRGLTIPSPYTELSNNISGRHREDDNDLDVISIWLESVT